MKVGVHHEQIFLLYFLVLVVLFLVDLLYFLFLLLLPYFLFLFQFVVLVHLLYFLEPGVVSQIVETPDGFHIIEVIEKKGDMFNARHILLKPEYTSEDREKGFKLLDSLRTELANEALTFELAARFYSEDPATRTNGGQMADPMTGSSYFEIDQLKPQDYAAIKNLKEGEISEPIESLDNEGRDGNLVYKIVKVDKIIPAHPATFQNDYTLLLDQASQAQSEKAIDEFIDSKIKSTYIVIDPLFKDCVFEREGWSEKFRKAE